MVLKGTQSRGSHTRPGFLTVLSVLITRQDPGGVLSALAQHPPAAGEIVVLVWRGCLRCHTSLDSEEKPLPRPLTTAGCAIGHPETPRSNRHVPNRHGCPQDGDGRVLDSRYHLFTHLRDLLRMPLDSPIGGS